MQIDLIRRSFIGVVDNDFNGIGRADGVAISAQIAYRVVDN